MKIIRNITPVMESGANFRLTAEIELTTQELEKAFRARQRQYLLEDISSAINEMVELNRISKAEGQRVLNDRAMIQNMADLYEHYEDCSVAYNDTLDMVIREVLKKSRMEVD